MNEKYKALEKNIEEKQLNIKIEKVFNKCEEIEQSISLKNYYVNQKYNKIFSSDYLNYKFLEDKYNEILEFSVINEFNKIRGKEFISFSSFHKVY